MRVRDSLLVGAIQGLAIVPGISRSGSTIACLMFLGVDRELAARYSFLLSIPAILGALLIRILDLESVEGIDFSALGAGFVVSTLTGILALALLVPLVKRGRFYFFALYLIPVGVIGLLYLP